jgi:hypothetical protein
MTAQFDRVLSVLTGVGIFAFAAINVDKVVSLAKGFVTASVTYMQGIAGLGQGTQ